jgi:hypothetical protein
MYWHHNDIQIAVFCNVIPHAVADTYTIQGNPLPPHSGFLTQTTPCRTLLVAEEGEGMVVRGLRVIKILSNIYRTFTTTFTGCRLIETIYLTRLF